MKTTLIMSPIDDGIYFGERINAAVTAQRLLFFAKDQGGISPIIPTLLFQPLLTKGTEDESALAFILQSVAEYEPDDVWIYVPSQSAADLMRQKLEGKQGATMRQDFPGNLEQLIDISVAQEHGHQYLVVDDQRPRALIGSNTPIAFDAYKKFTLTKLDD